MPLKLPPVVSLIASAVIVVGCAVGLDVIAANPQRPGRVHVIYWEKWTSFEFNGIKQIVDDFNASQDRIQVDIVSISNIENKTMFAISAGVPPDIAGLYSPNVPQYADEQAILPLDDFCAGKGIKESDYIPAYWQLVTYSGKIWALPTTPASTALHYNRKLLAAAGFDPNKPPKTVEELDAMSDKMTRITNGHIQEIGFTPSEPGWWNYAWGYYFGGKLWDGKSTITANAPGNLAAFRWIQGYAKRYGSNAISSFKSGLGQFDSPQNGFMSQQVAMEMQGVWMHNFINQYSKGLDIDAVPFPYPKDRPDLANTTYVDSDVLVIPRGAAHPKEAFEFIAYVQTQKEMEKLCLLHQKNSPLARISDNFWKQHKNPWIHLFDDLARSKNAQIPARFGIWPEYQQELTTAFDTDLTLTQSPEEILNGVQERMQAKLTRYQARLKRRRELGL